MRKHEQYHRVMRTLVEHGGGETDGVFVTKPGVMLFATEDGVTDSGRDLAKALHVYLDQQTHKLIAEFAARLTYLTFPKKPEDANGAKNWHQKMLEEFGHDSPYAIPPPVVLVAGCSVEASGEINAHPFAIGRGTSSRTKAMISPMLRADSESAVHPTVRKTLKLQMIAHRKVLEEDGIDPWELDSDSLEDLNQTLPGSKAIATLFGQNHRWYHWILGGRLGDHDGAERELRDILARVADELHAHYGTVICSAEGYDHQPRTARG